MSKSFHFFSKKRIIIICFIVSVTLASLPFWALDNHINLVYGQDDVRTIDTKFYETVTLPDVTKENYIFDGWYKDNIRVEEVSNVLGEQDIIAHFHPRSYYINFILPDFIDFTASNHALTYVYNKEKLLPELSNENYIFKGYKINDGEIRMSIPAGTSGTVKAEAIFEPKTFKISYELNGGAMNNAVTSYKYKEPFTLKSPVKKDFEFAGWYLDAGFTKKFNYSQDLSGDIKLYAYFKESVASIAKRTLAKPYVICGSYSASLISGADSLLSILDGPGAFHDFVAGKEYIADHNYQGASAFLYNNTLTVVRADGTEETYTKVSTNSVYWTPGIPVDILANYSGEIITQTCQGDDVVFNGWAKQ